jgi:Mlc titration factor MtfA (ptsG expression regulator)
VIFSWLKQRRRRKLAAAPLPAEWKRVIQRNVRLYRGLPPAEQHSLERRTLVFVAEKHWVGCGGLEMTDEVKVTIAAQACLMLLGVPEDFCFDGLLSVLVYPTAYLMPPQHQQHNVVVDLDLEMLGEAWHRGPVVLSWEHVLRGCRDGDDGQNVVIHEFAHQLDGLDGAADGMPPLTGRGEQRRWEQVAAAEYERLVASSERGEATLLDQYGATNRAEFFAVASECFFEQPLRLRRRHPELYEILRGLYRQDPAARREV